MKLGIMKTNMNNSIKLTPMLIVIVFCGPVIGAVSGWREVEGAGIIPAAIAGSVGAFVGAIVTASICWKLSRTVVPAWVLNGALFGTIGSGFGRADLSLLSGAVCGVFMGVIAGFDSRKLRKAKSQQAGT
jgi:uncharacterized membrane protein YeaQ/YmgE (transglycosylase-associated protein family)